MRTIRLALATTILAAAAATGVAEPAAAAATPEPVSNFVSSCRYSHSAPDDPIVHPLVPGASHSHDFFGNTSTDAFSTTLSLQLAPDLCARAGDKSAYWVPTLSDGGKVVKPTGVRAYYLVTSRDPASIQPFPLGLRVVTDATANVVRFACAGPGRDTRAGATPPNCPADSNLVMRIHFPDCWDGVHLDSVDHRSHMAYAVHGVCPASHPVAVPHLRLGVSYRSGVGGADATFSSGGPKTAHADFFNAWDPAAQARLVNSCLHADVVCGDKGPT